jgi:hypothetical protein
MLNPSTADAFRDDPTVARCRRRSAALGYAKMIIVNLFALRSTDPAGLYQEHVRGGSPVGPENDLFISRAAQEATLVVCGWGASIQKQFHRRPTHVMRLLEDADLRCLGTTKSGAPRHPLYIPSAAPLEPFPPLTPL